MSRLRVFVLVACALVTGCAKEAPTVVLDEWWNADFAKNSCESRKASGDNSCPLDPIAEVRHFDDEIATEFAASPECRGVRFVHYEGAGATSPEVTATMKGKFWSLMFDYAPGGKSQHWSLVSPVSSFMAGDGAPREIASKVCAIVNGRGASTAATSG